MEVLLHQINTRQRSGGAGAADFASSPAVENATKFIRASKITSEAISSALGSVAKNVEAAQSTVTKSMTFKLKLYVGGVVSDYHRGQRQRWFTESRRIVDDQAKTRSFGEYGRCSGCMYPYFVWWK